MIRISPKTLALLCFLISLVSRAQNGVSVVENDILITKTVAALKLRLNLELVEPGFTYAEQMARGGTIHSMIAEVAKGWYQKSHIIILLLEKGLQVEAEMYADIENLRPFLQSLYRRQNLKDQKSRDDLRIGFAK